MKKIIFTLILIVILELTIFFILKEEDQYLKEKKEIISRINIITTIIPSDFGNIHKIRKLSNKGKIEIEFIDIFSSKKTLILSFKDDPRFFSKSEVFTIKKKDILKTKPNDVLLKSTKVYNPEVFLNELAKKAPREKTLSFIVYDIDNTGRKKKDKQNRLVVLKIFIIE